MINRLAKACKLGLLTAVLSSPAQADRVYEILYNARIEAGQSHGQTYQFAMVSGFTRRGELAQRFEISHGDCGGAQGWDDCSNDCWTVERKERPKTVFSKPGEGIWYGSRFTSLLTSKALRGPIRTCHRPRSRAKGCRSGN